MLVLQKAVQIDTIISISSSAVVNTITVPIV